jgi:hypothetical protein
MVRARRRSKAPTPPRVRLPPHPCANDGGRHHRPAGLRRSVERCASVDGRAVGDRVDAHRVKLAKLAKSSQVDHDAGARCFSEATYHMCSEVWRWRIWRPGAACNGPAQRRRGRSPR